MSFFGICTLCVLYLSLDLDYLTYYKNKNPKDIPKPMPSANLKEVMMNWICAKIASLMKGKTAQEIRTMFNIECDLTEEELNKINSEIDYNNGWSFYIVVKNNNNFNIPISSTFSIDIKCDKNIDELGYCTEQNRNNNNEITLLCTPQSEINKAVLNFDLCDSIVGDIVEFKRNIKMDIQLHNNTIEEGEDKTQAILIITKEEDPLWDEPTHSLLGYAFYKCELICYLISNPSSISIISPDGKIMGQLDVDIIPHDENDNEYDEVPESPSELIGQSICFKVCIIGVKNLPVNFCRNLKVEYQTFYDKQVNYTKLYNEDNSNLTEFKIGEEIEHRIDYITKEDVEFLEKEKLCFKVYAYEDVEKKGKADVDEVLKIDKEIEQQLEEPAEVIPKNIKNMSDNFNNNNKINVQNNNNNNRVNRNKFGYSNNQQNLNKINPKITNSQMEKYGKGKNDKDCSIF